MRYPIRTGLEYPLWHLPSLLGVVTLTAFPALLCEKIFAGVPGSLAEPSQVLLLEPNAIPHVTAEVSVSSSWDLFSSSLWDPSWFWPLGDATRFPLPQRVLRDSSTQGLVLTPVAPAPLSAILRPPPASAATACPGLGEEAPPPPGSATCAAAAAAARPCSR